MQIYFYSLIIITNIFATLEIIDQSGKQMNPKDWVYISDSVTKEQYNKAFESSIKGLLNRSTNKQGNLIIKMNNMYKILSYIFANKLHSDLLKQTFSFLYCPINELHALNDITALNMLIEHYKLAPSLHIPSIRKLTSTGNCSDIFYNITMTVLDKFADHKNTIKKKLETRDIRNFNEYTDRIIIQPYSEIWEMDLSFNKDQKLNLLKFSVGTINLHGNNTNIAIIGDIQNLFISGKFNRMMFNIENVTDFLTDHPEEIRHNIIINQAEIHSLKFDVSGVFCKLFPKSIGCCQNINLFLHNSVVQHLGENFKFRLYSNQETLDKHCTVGMMPITMDKLHLFINDISNIIRVRIQDNMLISKTDKPRDNGLFPCYIRPTMKNQGKIISTFKTLNLKTNEYESKKLNVYKSDYFIYPNDIIKPGSVQYMFYQYFKNHSNKE